MKRLGAVLETLATAVAITAALLVAGLAWLEASGTLDHRVKALLHGRAGESLSVERVRFDWRRGGLIVRGIELGGPEGPLALERVRIGLGWSPRAGFGARQIAVEGGHAHLGPELERAIEALVERFGAGGFAGAAPARRGPWPKVSATGLALSLDAGPGAAALPVGEVRLWLEDGGAAARLFGEWLPRFAREAPALSALRIAGTWDRERGLDLRLLRTPAETPRGALPLGEWFPRADFDGLSGRLGIEGRLRLRPEGDIDIEARVLGEELTSHGPPERGRLEAGSLLVHAHHRRRSGQTLLDPEVWAGGATLGARFADAPVALLARFGRDAGGGALLDLEARVDGARVDAPATLRTTMDLTGPRTARGLADAWDALGLSGRAALRLGLRLAPPGPDFVFSEPEIAFAIDTLGEIGVDFAGWPEADGGRTGFPLPARGVHGRLVFAHEPSHVRRDRFALLGVVGELPVGEVRMEGLIGSPDPEAPEDDRRPEVRLVLELEGLPADEELARALVGLDLGFDPLVLFGLFGGSLGARVDFDQRLATGGMHLAALVAWRELEGRVELPGAHFPDGLELGGLTGSVAVAWPRVRPRPAAAEGREARPPRAFGWSLETSGSAAGESFRVRMESRQDPVAAPGAEPVLERRFQGQAGLPSVALDGALAAAWFAFAGERDGDLDPRDLGASGQVQIELLARAEPGRAPRLDVDLAGRPLAFAPKDPPAAIADVRGQVHVALDLDLVAEADQAFGLSVAAASEPSLRGQAGGRGLGGARIAARLAPGDIELAAAGLDPGAPALRELIARLTGAEPPAAGAPLLTGGVDLVGAFDARARLVPGSIAEGSELELVLRENRLVAPGVGLEALEGRVRLRPGGGRVESERLRARFAEVPVELRSARLYLREGADEWRGEAPPAPHPAGEAARALLVGELWFEDLPLDPRTEGLAEALEEALPEGGPPWSGVLDALGVRLALALGSPQGPTAWLDGDLLAHDARLDLGVPIAIPSARVRLERLVIEDGDARAWGRVEGLYARIAGRTIDEASLVATYSAGRLTVDDLAARFSGGVVRPLGGTRTLGRVLSLDLVPPYRFDLALELADLDLALLLADAFGGGSTSRGRLSASLQVAGEPGDPMGLAGSGRMRIERARLGSIPVVRAVFRALGFDATATFDWAEARFALADGTARVDELVLHSPLLKLVGSGSVGLDGSLRQDLRVTYALVDLLGPFRRLVYWFQNRLLWVSVRGDLARPQVRARNVLLDALQTRRGTLPILPLPPAPDPPRRF